MSPPLSPSRTSHPRAHSRSPSQSRSHSPSRSPSPAPFDAHLTPIESIKDVQQARALLASVVQQESALDAELDTMLAQSGGITDALASLDNIRPHIATLLSDSFQLQAIVHKAAGLANRISSQVSALDAKQARVAQAVKVVDGVRELQSILHTLTNTPLTPSNLPQATGASARFLLLDPTLLRSVLATPSMDASVSLPTPPAGSLAALGGVDPVGRVEEARATLRTVLEGRFDEAAVQKGGGGSAVDVLVMMAQAGFGEVGMEKMAAWACGEVGRAGSEGLRGVGSAPPPAHFAHLFTSLFEHIADLVDRLQPVVEAHFGGRTRTRYLCRRLQRECDVQATLVVDAFLERREVARKCAAARSFRPSTGRSTPGAPGSLRGTTSPIAPSPTSAGSSGVDARDLDAVLVELATMGQRAAMYERFLVGRVGQDLTPTSAHSKSKDDGRNGSVDAGDDNEDFVRGSKLAARVQELMGYYVQLEELFVRMSIEKALAIDTVDDATNTSSSPDDVFYVVRKSLERTLSSLSVDSLCAMLNLVGRVVEEDYVDVLGRRVGGAWASHPDPDRARRQFMVAVNDTDMAVGYVHKLVGEMREAVPGVLGGEVYERNREKIGSCLAGLEEYAAGFKQLLKNWIENLFSQTLRPRLRIMLSEALKDVKYVLTEEEYNDLQEGSFAKRVAGTLTRLMETYENTYTENNFAATMNHVLDYVAKEWQKHILANLRFNQLGAIQFDKDVRSLAAALSAMTTVNVRDKMARLTQISNLVNLERVAEVYDYQSSLNLSAADIRTILALRSDFPVDEIARLRL
ncbi:COG4-domain-containing protein [Gonapodya prolifera JEL478]|uniref:Conserved oligomeric Golgi complex subunit 4 n=1 Tax=Gonapodya prolifera (strain JEL478) TaxID=1344416 RepID=A0A139A0G0_GONPJ|nr:COG4-domain-containing protein [Gonapodya prolifera JEL478]|eukprot:KXS10025.1 COG4-domain-containing protein [Gonapodya prolifera JEL478]